jgi:RNA recognition motif-containing protein
MILKISNLPLDVDSEILRQLVSQFGTVLSADVIIDKFNGYSKGFGFVKMKTLTDGFNVITNLHGLELKGQALQVHEKLND